MLSGGHATLCVRDMERAVRFYVETLGMKLVDHGPSRSVLDAGDGLHIALERSTDAPSSGRGTTSIDLMVRNSFDHAVAIYENRGVVFEPAVAPEGVRLVRFTDPDGNRLGLKG